MATNMSVHPFTTYNSDVGVVGATLVITEKNSTVSVVLAIQDEMDVTAKSQGSSACGFNKTAQALSRLADKIGLILPTDNPSIEKWIAVFNSQNHDGAMIEKIKRRLCYKGK